MIFDDRIRTILAGQPAGPDVARAQFRQLIDLLTKGIADDESEDAIAERFKVIGGLISSAERLAILREVAPTPSSVPLVLQLSRMGDDFSDFALAQAALKFDEWLALLPRLNAAQRITLTFRRDLPEPVLRSLRRDGPRGAPVREILRRIEDLRAGHTEHARAVDLPLRPRKVLTIELDASGMIVAASDVQGALCGRRLTGTSDPSTQLSGSGRNRLAAWLPCQSARLSLLGASQVTGDWLLHATPRFDPVSLAFTGHHGLLEPIDQAIEEDHLAELGERGRRLLHELRTPLNAILGFAEALQQQMLGPLPPAYRAAAATAIAEASRMLAACEDAEELIRLEVGEPHSGEHTDMVEILRRSMDAFASIASVRGIVIERDIQDRASPIACSSTTAGKVLWTMLAETAGQLRAGGTLRVSGPKDGGDRAVVMSAEGDATSSWISNGPYPPAFTRRLAQLRAEAFGGEVTFKTRQASLSINARPARTPYAFVE